MKTLYVLYDHTCGMCCAAARRLSQEPRYLELAFLPLASMQAQERFGAAIGPPPHNQVIVVADTGEVYRGSSAWLMVLYALRRYRGLSIALSRPGWRPLVERVIHIVSRRRATLSELFGCTPDVDVLATARGAAMVGGAVYGCESGGCAINAPSSSGVSALRSAKDRATQITAPG